MHEDHRHYDIIGDIHGRLPELVRLLEKLGYREIDGAWQHPERTAVFLGDFIDRGEGQREVIHLVRAMVDNRYAMSVMGNHEYNAIAYATLGQGGEYLRAHDDKNRQQHQAFLAAYENDKESYLEVINWFKTLPLWLELEGFRVIHACWDERVIAKLQQHYTGSLLTDELLHASCNEEAWEYEAMETLLKGKEIPLPLEHDGFYDKDGNRRHHIRVKWWKEGDLNYREAYLGPEDALTHIPDDPIVGDHMVVYSKTERPVFIGHYWLQGDPEPLSDKIACLDYSVAKEGGKLVAYCWDGEATLSKAKFVTVPRA